MPAELFMKTGFGRRLRRIAQSATAGLIKINSALYTSIGVTPPAPTVTAPPSIAGAGGDDAVGTLFTATPGVYTNSPIITRRWLANDTEIPGQTGLTLDSTSLQAGDTIECEETATNTGGAVVSKSNAIVLTEPN